METSSLGCRGHVTRKQQQKLKIKTLETQKHALLNKKIKRSLIHSDN